MITDPVLQSTVAVLLLALGLVAGIYLQSLSSEKRIKDSYNLGKLKGIEYAGNAYREQLKKDQEEYIKFKKSVQEQIDKMRLKFKNVLTDEKYLLEFGIKWFGSKEKAAKEMNIPRSTFYRRCKKHGI